MRSQSEWVLRGVISDGCNCTCAGAIGPLRWPVLALSGRVGKILEGLRVDSREDAVGRDECDRYIRGALIP